MTPCDSSKKNSVTLVRRSTRRHIREDNILNCYSREQLSQKTAIFQSISFRVGMQQGREVSRISPASAEVNDYIYIYLDLHSSVHLNDLCLMRHNDYFALTLWYSKRVYLQRTREYNFSHNHKNVAYRDLSISWHIVFRIPSSSDIIRNQIKHKP
jgi:hypothetical protein